MNDLAVVVEAAARLAASPSAPRPTRRKFTVGNRFLLGPIKKDYEPAWPIGKVEWWSGSDRRNPELESGVTATGKIVPMTVSKSRELPLDGVEPKSPYNGGVGGTPHATWQDVAARLDALAE